MEPLENNSLPEILQTIKINPETGEEFLFTSPVVMVDTTHTSDMSILQFVLYALRRLCSLDENERALSPDEIELKEDAAEVLPIFSTTLSEVSVNVSFDDKETEVRYNFQYSQKDKITIDSLTRPNHGDATPEEETAIRSFFHDLLKECFSGKAVAYVLSLYIDIHRDDLVSNVKKKTRNRKRAEPKNKSPFKVSGHLVDQKLKYFRPGADPSLISIFDSLTSETKDKIKADSGKKSNITADEVQHTTVVEGIKLSPSEHKVIDSLCKLLHDKSEVFDTKSLGYYAGNREIQTIPYGENKRKEIAPQIGFTLYELTKEFKGGEALSGKDVANVASILAELDTRRFLLSYTEKIHKKGGERTERKIEEFQPLIRLLKYSESNYTNTNALAKQSEEIIVSLNPIFRHQIDSKFILYPYDLNRRTIIAYGSHNIADATLRLRDYLLREQSYSHPKCEINIENLYWMLCEKWMKEKRKRKVTEYVDRAIQTVKRLGILLKHEIVTGAEGQLKMIFHLDPEWQ